MLPSRPWSVSRTPRQSLSLSLASTGLAVSLMGVWFLLRLEFESLRSPFELAWMPVMVALFTSIALAAAVGLGLAVEVLGTVGWPRRFAVLSTLANSALLVGCAFEAGLIWWRFFIGR